MPDPCRAVWDQIVAEQADVRVAQSQINDAATKLGAVARIRQLQQQERDSEQALAACLSQQFDAKHAQHAAQLGAPVSSLTASGDGKGWVRLYEHGGIFWTAETGTCEVHGLIFKKWKATGREHGPLGYPECDHSATTGGAYNNFENGIINLMDGANQAFETHGPISAHYAALHRETGILGFVQVDQTATPDGVGRFNHFEAGSIYWKPSVGAHEVHGAIWNTWGEEGFERSPELGYPIADEQAGANHIDRFSDFENGILYWVHGSTGGLLSAPAITETRDQVAALIKTKVDDLITSVNVGHPLYVTHPAKLIGVSDYSVGPSGAVRNRMHLITVSFGITVEGTNDPDVTLNMAVEVRLNHALKQVEAVPRAWTKIDATLDWPTNWGASAQGVANQVWQGLDGLLNQPIKVLDAPDGVLVVKVRSDGTIDAYIGPTT